MRTRPTRTSRAGCGCISSTAANHTANARMSSRSTRAGGDAHGPSRAVRSRLPERNTNERKVIMIVTKRIYEPVDERDGYRVLVDRLWPRGVSKAAARVDEWAKTISPLAMLKRCCDCWRRAARTRRRTRTVRLRFEGYVSWSERLGSTRVARRAGAHDAVSAITITTIARPRYVAGSAALTSYS